MKKSVKFSIVGLLVAILVTVGIWFVPKLIKQNKINTELNHELLIDKKSEPKSGDFSDYLGEIKIHYDLFSKKFKITFSKKMMSLSRSQQNQTISLERLRVYQQFKKDNKKYQGFVPNTEIYYKGKVIATGGTKNDNAYINWKK